MKKNKIFTNITIFLFLCSIIITIPNVFSSRSINLDLNDWEYSSFDRGEISIHNQTPLLGLTKNRNIMLTGFWNPTGQMISSFSTDHNLNPDGWKGENWENSGYDLYSYFPTPHQYNGNFEVDYQKTWDDFWRITSEINPIAIISFGAGDGPWEIEYNARNLDQWVNDDEFPYQPTPSPPDDSVETNFIRHSSLPLEEIRDAVNDEVDLNAWIDWEGNPGEYLCEYIAYLGMWYQSIHDSSEDQYPCKTAGFIHVNSRVSVEDATKATVITIRETIQQLDDTTPPSVEIVNPSNGATVSGIVTIKAPASDNKGVSKVEFYIDGTLIGTDSSAPYEWNWDTMGFANGECSIKAIAYDRAGNTAEDSISVIVDNGDIVLVEDTFNGAVAGHEVDYYAIQVLPGEMSVTASWSGNKDIDVYICTAEDYTDYLARGYTSNNPETCSYDIQTAGTYYVAVRMYTQSASSTDYTLKVKYYTSGSGEDTTPPTVNIISPADAAEVSGIVTIEFSATDTSGIASQAILIDEVVVSTSNTHDWDTRGYAVGEHIIRCEATDTSENANIGYAEITVVIKDTSLEDAILSISAPSEIEPTGSFDVTLRYSAKGERNIVVSLVNGGGSIFASTSISVSEGEGEETVTLTDDGTTPSGTDYVIEVKMLDLSDIEVAIDTTPITVKEEGEPASLFTDLTLISIFALGAAVSILLIQKKSRIR